MKIQQFLDHHGISVNPFSEEDAQTDPVFKDHCILSTYHPSWDKVYGDPAEPATSIVFGEKGSGKTALRSANRAPSDRVQPPASQWAAVRHRVRRFQSVSRSLRRAHGPAARRGDQVLAQWKLWDHMDAILSLGVTQLVDRMLESQRQNKKPHRSTSGRSKFASSIGTRRATCCCWPLVTIVDGRSAAPPLASVAPQAAFSHLAGPMAGGARVFGNIGRDRHRGRRRSLEMVRDAVAVRR